MAISAVLVIVIVVAVFLFFRVVAAALDYLSGLLVPRATLVLLAVPLRPVAEADGTASPAPAPPVVRPVQLVDLPGHF